MALLVHRVQFPRSNSDLIITQRSRNTSALKESETQYIKTEFEKAIPRAGFIPQPIQHPYSRPKVGSSQVGRNAKHMQFLRSSPSLAELNKQIRRNEFAKSTRCRTAAPRNVTSLPKEEKIELRKLEDLFRVYKGNRDLIKQIFPSASSAGGTPEPHDVSMTSQRSSTNSPVLIAPSRQSVLNNPLQVINFQEKGRAKSAVTQDTIRLRNRPPLAHLNTNSHVPVPLYAPPSSTPRKGNPHNPAAYVPQTMAPYLYGIRGRPVNASEKQYPVSRSSQTNLGEPKSSLTSLRRSHTTMGKLRRMEAPLYPPMVPPATPQNDSSSRLPNPSNMTTTNTSLSRGLVGESLDLNAPLESKQVPKSMNDEAAESQQTTSPRQGFTKQQSHVRFLLDDEVEQKARRNEEVQEQKKAPEHSQESLTNEQPTFSNEDEKSDIDSIEGYSNRDQNMGLNQTSQPTITSRIESGASLPVEVYDVKKL
ncbi:uncharacterized protein LOC134856010 isoform X2 [Symsagittifera roscoffensis]|uniref:uncharacterized protein LOC134856010 isoform X2 n=1 Tax=Symsagittifera roscoffensis TaxID=84072 RepID=UPI00307C65CD